MRGLSITGWGVPGGRPRLDDRRTVQRRLGWLLPLVVPRSGCKHDARSIGQDNVGDIRLPRPRSNGCQVGRPLVRSGFVEGCKRASGTLAAAGDDRHGAAARRPSSPYPPSGDPHGAGHQGDPRHHAGRLTYDLTDLPRRRLCAGGASVECRTGVVRHSGSGSPAVVARCCRPAERATSQSM
jgi:hypothetical protein